MAIASASSKEAFIILSIKIIKMMMMVMIKMTMTMMIMMLPMIYLIAARAPLDVQYQATHSFSHLNVIIRKGVINRKVLSSYLGMNGLKILFIDVPS